MRLQKYLSRAGVASRRAAEGLIGQGRVSVDGVRAKIGDSVADDATVRVDGRVVRATAERVVRVANKPVGMVTTLHDPEGRPTVASLVPEGLRLYPVGRLDFETGGLLVLTDDGALTHLLTHPRYGVEKTYRVRVGGRMTNESIAALQSGVRLDDGVTARAQLRVLAARREHTVFDLTIHEGRNRQIRRMVEALGHEVQMLVRTHFGPFALGDLPVGALREPHPAEWAALERIADAAEEDSSDDQ